MMIGISYKAWSTLARLAHKAYLSVIHRDIGRELSFAVPGSQRCTKADQIRRRILLGEATQQDMRAVVDSGMKPPIGRSGKLCSNKIILPRLSADYNLVFTIDPEA